MHRSIAIELIHALPSVAGIFFLVSKFKLFEQNGLVSLRPRAQHYTLTCAYVVL